MVRRILWYLLWAMVVVLVIAWLLTGGIGKIQNAAASFSFTNPIAFIKSGFTFTLPWQPTLPRGPNIVGLSDSSGSSGANTSQQSQAETFGNPSSNEGTVTINATGATASNPQSEYVEIANNGSGALDITGWSLQSVISGARAYIPRGSALFQIGALNPQTDIELAPGGSAIITTGVSPVGTSFRENECSGYLGQLQNYTPQIQTQCPSPSNAAGNAQQYGQACADFVSSLSSCKFPNQLPPNISSACVAYVQTNFSYNGCVQAYQNDPSFSLQTWRIYLDASQELWNSQHDTIRVLNAQGEVVAVTSY
jgi:hypothetical protein